MYKYSDIEVETARNLAKRGYRWLARDMSGILFAYTSKPTKDLLVWYEKDECGMVMGCFVAKTDIPIFKAIQFCDENPTLINSIFNANVLDAEERRYLEMVLRPLPRVKAIEKAKMLMGEEIIVKFDTGTHPSTLQFPVFTNGKMYRGMEANHYYTPEELGLNLRSEHKTFQ